jgi:SAM-dependent methyltransferase
MGLAEASRLLQRLGTLAFSKVAGGPRCYVCGFSGRCQRGTVVWPALVAEWELSPEWAAWLDEREAWRCARCGSSRRSSSLAHGLVEALTQPLGSKARTLITLSAEPAFQALSVAEINSAGDVHGWLARNPGLRYSEFGSVDPAVPSESLSRLSYGDGTFDLVVTSETLEHVPDVDVALTEIWRVLRPGGQHVFTVPIVWDGRQTRRRASIEDGRVVHHLPPSHHGSGTVNAPDYLVFYEFGSDFVPRCSAAGFSTRIVEPDSDNLMLRSLIGVKA